MKNPIDALRYFTKKFPQQALEEAIANPEATREQLLNELDHMLEHPESTVENRDYMLHFYAVYLLAQFREKAACRRILDLVSLPSELVDSMFGDLITQDLHSIIYSTFDGDVERLKAVIENPEVDQYVRGAVLEVYGQLYRDGVVSKEEIVSYLRTLLQSEEMADEEFLLATTIQGVIIDCKLFEMMEDVQALYDNGRIDEMFVGRYDSFVDAMYDYSYMGSTVRYIDDAIEASRGWGMFEKTEEDRLEEEKRSEEMDAVFKKLMQKEQTVTVEKVGRNDPCPCGSGKKYKKCCLKKDQMYRSKHQETLAVQIRWLADYPPMEGERQEGEVRITDTFDEEAIEIDRLVYLALHHRPSPMWEQKDYEKEALAKGSYLLDAFAAFKAKAEKEGSQSFEAYDRRHKIHYRSADWLIELRKMFDREPFAEKFGDPTLEAELDEVIKQLG